MQNLESEINNLLSSYDKNNPNYKFTHTFYNISEVRTQPYNFPTELWNDLIMKAPSLFHTPVLIKGFDELSDRIKKQTELLKNIVDSFDNIDHRYNAIKLRTKALKGRIDEVTNKCRGMRICENLEIENIRERIFKIKQKMKGKRKPIVFDNKEHVMQLMWTFKNIGEGIKKDVIFEKKNK